MLNAIFDSEFGAAILYFSWYLCWNRENDLDIDDTLLLFFFSKLLTQVLNRVTASSNLFENVTRLHLPGNACGRLLQNRLLYCFH